MGGGKQVAAAKEQAAATKAAAAATAKDNKLKAQAAQQQQESMIARQLAADKVAQLEKDQPKQTVETNIGATEDEATADEMGRRRKPRDAFRKPSSSGLNI